MSCFCLKALYCNLSIKIFETFSYYMDFDLIFNSNPSIESFREYKLNFRISSNNNLYTFYNDGSYTQSQ